MTLVTSSQMINNTKKTSSSAHSNFQVNFTCVVNFEFYQVANDDRLEESVNFVDSYSS